MTTEDINNELYAKRIKIHNRWVNGFFQNIRSGTIWVTLAIFFIMPWVYWNGRQAILFDIKARQFHIFSMTFWPQDFYLLVLLILSSALTLFVITHMAGRIYCGYFCPQTVWTKCFMWLEYMIEGDRNTRIKNDKNPWQPKAILRRTLKHISWLGLALFTSLTFVSYFAPVREVFTLSLGQWGFGAIAFFTLATYTNAGWMREQVCTYICPYARFQSVMLDEDSLVITYDYNRGEPRGSVKSRKENANPGDCVDCSLCVQVCPTGIDIRQGLQMACIGCAACVDICNSVMEKVSLPQGLIRYSTHNLIENKKSKVLRPSLIIATAFLGLLLAVFTTLLIKRIPLQVNISHDQRNLYRVMPSGDIENSYVISVDNMMQATQTYMIKFQGTKQITYVGSKSVTLKPGENAVIPITLTAPKGSLPEFNNTIHFRIQSKEDPNIYKEINSNFFSPE